jgi:hypothetical protein
MMFLGRGCQEKNSPPPLRGDIDVVSCIQPCVSLLRLGGVLVLCALGSRSIPGRPTRLMVPTRRFHDAVVSTPSAPEATQAKVLAKVPTMILCETRGL